MVSSLVSFHVIVVLSQEADSIVSRNCGLVVIWVTQLLWPLRVPPGAICSVLAAAGIGVTAEMRIEADGWQR